MIRKARAQWRGTGRDGDGDLTTDSAVLSETPYSFKTRFENERGTSSSWPATRRRGSTPKPRSAWIRTARDSASPDRP